MKAFIKIIVNFFRKYILCCIIPYDEPMIEVEPLLVADVDRDKQQTSSISGSGNNSNLLIESALEQSPAPAKSEKTEKARKPAYSISRAHHLPSNCDLQMLIAGGYLGQHNRKITKMVNAFNAPWEEESSQYSNNDLK